MNTILTIRRLLLAVVAACCFTTPAFAQVDMIIVINGITGSSKILPGAIDLRSAGNGLTVPAPTGGAGASVVKFTEFKLQKSIDKATPLLMDRCAKGTAFNAGLYVRANKDGRTDYLLYELQNVRVTSISTSTSASGEMVEELSLNFEQIKLTVLEGGDTTSFSWNIATNTP